MSYSDSTRERAVLAFLEQLLQDREHGKFVSVEEYVALFPEIEDRVREELAACSGESEAPALNGPEDSSPKLGPYRLGRVIGEGGQGVVYEAFDTRLGREVALKVLPRALAAGEGVLPPQLQRELEAMARLDHPGIGVVHDAGECDGQVYLAMRLIRGRALSQVVGKLSWQDAAHCMMRVARALHVAHQAGVVHRDVKPANILLEDSGNPVLIDFGLARTDGGELPTLTRTGDVLGTPHYLAPERLNGRAHRDFRGEVWSLGVTLYELVTGNRPFRGHSIEAVAQAVVKDEPDPLHRVDARVPRDLAVVVQTALSKELGRRYQNAEEFANELERVLAGLPIRARPISFMGRTSRWVRRNPAPAAICVLLALGAGTGALTADAFRGLAEERTEALASAEVGLAESRLEQARLLQYSTFPGRSLEMLERINASAQARSRALGLGADPEDLPSLPTLRSMSLDAQLLPDAVPAQTISHEGYALGGISQNGRWLASRRVLATPTGLVTQEVLVHDLLTGEVVARSTRSELCDRQEGIAVSNDGRWVALPGPDETSIDLWDLNKDLLVKQLPIPTDIRLQEGERDPERHLRLWKLVFSPDGKRLAMSVAPRESRQTLPSPRGFALWDLETAAVLAGQRFGTTRYPWLGFSADSKRLVVNPEPRVAELYAETENDGVPTFESIARIDVGMVVKCAAVVSGQDAEIVIVAGPDGGGSELLVRLDAKNATLSWRRQLDRACEWAHAPGLAISPDGEQVLMAYEDGAIESFGIQDGRTRLLVQDAHAGRVESLTWLPNGTGWSSHARAADSKRWAIQAAAPFVHDRPVPHGGAEQGMFASDSAGQTFAFIAQDRRETVQVWRAEPADFESIQLQADRRAASVYELLFDPAGEALFEVGTTLCTRWDLVTGNFEHREPSAGAEFIHGGFDDRFDLWLVERQEGRFALVRFEDGERRDLDQLPESAWLDRSDQGMWSIAIPRGEDPSLPTLAKQVEGGSYEPVTHLSWPGMPTQADLQRRNARVSEDGRWIAMMIRLKGYELFVWDAHLDRLVTRIPMGGDPEWASYDLDEVHARLAYGGEDGRVSLVDLETGELWASWQAHQSEVRYLRFVGKDQSLLTWASLEPARCWKQKALQTSVAGLEAGPARGGTLSNIVED